MKRCQAITKKGEQCRRQCSSNMNFCPIHLKETYYFEKEIESSIKFRGFSAIITHPIYQVILTLIFFFVVFLLFKDNHLIGSYISIPTQTVRDFFLLISQIIAAISGLYIAFIILSIQITSSERSKSIDLLQEKVEKINELIYRLPTEINILKTKYEDLLEELHDQIMFMGGNEKVQSFDSLEKIMRKIFAIMKKEDLPFEYITLVNTYLWNTKRIIRKSIIIYIGSITIKKTNRIIRKILLLLGISLMFYLLFGIIDVRGLFPNLNAPILFSYILYMLLIFFEFIQYIYYLFENLRDWK